jgi:hypothetical protein
MLNFFWWYKDSAVSTAVWVSATGGLQQHPAGSLIVVALAQDW